MANTPSGFAYPFINFSAIREININNTPRMIFGSQYLSKVSDLVVTNMADLVSKYTLYILSEVSPGKTIEAVVHNELSVTNKGNLYFPDLVITLSPGELLYAYSDASNKPINITGSAIEYKEIGG